MPKKTSRITEIPVFFAVDDRYAPYCAVTLTSLVDTVSQTSELSVHILTDSLSAENRDKLRACVGRHKIRFVDVREKAKRLSDRICLRDYYTKATYYRFFIAELFLEYDKALYLDSDLLITADVTPLFNTPLAGRLVGAIPEEVMQNDPAFSAYADRFLGVPYTEYFNAGVLVMNLREMRRAHLEEKFVTLLSEKTYRVAQDQDYLNVLAYGKTALLPTRWNRTAYPSSPMDAAGIIHFKLFFKPWRTDECLGAARFWKVAARTPYADALRAEHDCYTYADRCADRGCYNNLVRLATSEVASLSGDAEQTHRVRLFGAIREA